MVEFVGMASDVEEKDFLPGIGDAYVFDVDYNADFRNEYNVSITQGMVVITVHNHEGDEDTLILSPTTQITIRRN